MPRSLRAREIASSVVAPVARMAFTIGNRPAANFGQRGPASPHRQEHGGASYGNVGCCPETWHCNAKVRHCGEIMGAGPQGGRLRFGAGLGQPLASALLRSERWSLIDLVIYFACVSAGQSPPVIRGLGPAFLLHLCNCLLGLVSTMRRSSRQVIVTHVTRLFLHHSNPKLNVAARLHIIRCSS